jgi:hypothetical protein
MIMLPGKPPYSQQGGESPIDNIIRMDFSYPLGDLSNKKTPDGPWRFIWSHLPYDIKSAFYHTFKKGGDYSTEDSRLTVDQWLDKFRYYLELLDSGKYGSRDKMSEELFPTRHQRHPDVVYAKCKLCHREVPEDSCQEGICYDCLNTGDVYKCQRCGKEILFTNYLKYIKKAKPHRLCPECFEDGKKIHTTMVCLVCGRHIPITNSEYEFYRSKGFSLPKRCKECRDKARRVRYSMPSRTYSAPRGRSSSGPGKGSMCFITTAVCQYLQKEDDCSELTSLRRFRDEWLQNQADGKTLIAEYYQMAPEIVNKLAKAPTKDAIYNCLWRDYIKPCISHIEAGEYLLCVEKYTGMVNFLREILL